MTGDEARAVLQGMEGDKAPGVGTRIAEALAVMVDEVRPSGLIDSTSEVWHPLEHSVWRLFARVQECLHERKDLRGKGPVLDAIADLCVDTSLGRGRQLGVLLLGERGGGGYDEVLNTLLVDPAVYGHALDALTRSQDRSARAEVERILESEKIGWIRRAAKKYLEPPKTPKRRS